MIMLAGTVIVRWVALGLILMMMIGMFFIRMTMGCGF
jgi:hypothetical protein